MEQQAVAQHPSVPPCTLSVTVSLLAMSAITQEGQAGAAGFAQPRQDLAGGCDDACLGH
jgi:hypothetical protein